MRSISFDRGERKDLYLLGKWAVATVVAREAIVRIIMLIKCIQLLQCYIFGIYASEASISDRISRGERKRRYRILDVWGTQELY